MKKITKRKGAFTAIIIACKIVLCDFSIAQENNSKVFYPDTLGNEKGLCEEKNTGTAPTSFTTANFVEVGSPAGGYPSITDMVTFNGKLYLSTSKNPLADFGTNVFSTSDGISYTKVLEDNTSQGYLRMGVFDNKLWIPDGDPNGLDPSYVYISSTGAPNSFTQTQITGSVHSFEVIKYNNQFYVSNGMGSGQGGLCKFDGSGQWTLVYADNNSVRMKYMAVFNGKLFVANRNSAGDVDYFVWSGDPQTTSPVQANVLSGATNTFRWFASSQGKLFWSVGTSSAIGVMVTQDGVNWQAVSALNGKLVSDFAEFNGKLYALAMDGLWESTDYFTFQKIASPPAADTEAFVPSVVGAGVNPDAPASMEAYNGSLWCGSSRNGKIYKVDFATSVPGILMASDHYKVTDRSIIFQIENSSSIELRVYSINGSLIKNVSLGTVTKGNYEIGLDELKEGTYLLQAIIGNEVKGIKYVRR